MLVWQQRQQTGQYEPRSNRLLGWIDQQRDVDWYVEYETPVDDSTPAPGMFEQLDKNSDGFLSKEELPRPILFGLLDHNKDGKVTKSEAINKI